MKLRVGNVSRFTSEEELKATFAKHGPVRSVTLVQNPRTGDLERVGFVEYETREGAEGGLLALNGAMLHGSMLSVNLAPTY